MLCSERSIWTMLHGVGLGGAALLGLAAARDLSEFPRALLLAAPGTAWLHAFAMESKEHMPWIASMLTTAVAFVAVRYRANMLQEPSVRRLSMALLAAGIGAMAMGAAVLLNEAGIFAAPTLYPPAGGVSGRTTLATLVWLAAWAVLHNRWKAREIPPARVSVLTLVLIALGVLGTFPPVWALFG